MRVDVTFEPLTLAHIEAIDMAPARRALHRQLWRPEFISAFLPDKLAFAALVAGRVVGAGGVIAETPWCGHAWGLVGRDMPRGAWPAITRKVRATIEDAHRNGMHRIYARVHARSAAACLWIRRLGFEADGIERAWFPDRGDAILVSRVA